jgi:NADH-quinone oxidoreductase subunit C
MGAFIMATQFESFFDELKTKYNLTIRESAPSEPELKVSVQNFKELLKDLQSRGYVHMADLTAYDEAPASPRFHVVYELISMESKKRCSVVVPVSDLDPKISTVTDIWKGAEWLEREVYDMYGIVFEGHADMRRILLPHTFKGHPLRKDFIVDYRQEFEKKVVDEGMFDPFGTTVVRGKGVNS